MEGKKSEGRFKEKEVAQLESEKENEEKWTQIYRQKKKKKKKGRGRGKEIWKQWLFQQQSFSKDAQYLFIFITKYFAFLSGFVYGAKDNKKLKVFIDDLNLPACDENNIQRCNELLRQLLDERQLCTVQKPFEWHTVEGMSVISAMALSDYPGVVNKPLNERLLVSLTDLR